MCLDRTIRCLSSPSSWCRCAYMRPELASLLICSSFFVLSDTCLTAIRRSFCPVLVYRGPCTLFINFVAHLFLIFSPSLLLPHLFCLFLPSFFPSLPCIARARSRVRVAHVPAPVHCHSACVLVSARFCFLLMCWRMATQLFVSASAYLFLSDLAPLRASKVPRS